MRCYRRYQTREFEIEQAAQHRRCLTIARPRPMSFFALQVANPDISLTLIAPELIVGIAGVIVMMVDAFSRRTQHWATGALSLAALVAAGIASVWLWLTEPA